MESRASYLFEALPESDLQPRALLELPADASLADCGRALGQLYGCSDLDDYEFSFGPPSDGPPRAFLGDGRQGARFASRTGLARLGLRPGRCFDFDNPTGPLDEREAAGERSFRAELRLLARGAPTEALRAALEPLGPSVAAQAQRGPSPQLRVQLRALFDKLADERPPPLRQQVALARQLLDEAAGSKAFFELAERGVALWAWLDDFPEVLGNAHELELALEFNERLAPFGDEREFARNRAFLLQAAGRVAEARAQLERALERYPSDLDIELDRGDLHALAGRSAEAEACYRGVLARTQDPRHRRPALEQLIELLRSLGRAEEAAPLSAELGEFEARCEAESEAGAEANHQRFRESLAQLGTEMYPGTAGAAPCPCESGKKYKHCCARPAPSANVRRWRAYDSGLLAALRELGGLLMPREMQRACTEASGGDFAGLELSEIVPLLAPELGDTWVLEYALFGASPVLEKLSADIASVEASEPEASVPPTREARQRAREARERELAQRDAAQRDAAECDAAECDAAECDAAECDAGERDAAECDAAGYGAHGRCAAAAEHPLDPRTPVLAPGSDPTARPAPLSCWAALCLEQCDGSFEPDQIEVLRAGCSAPLRLLCVVAREINADMQLVDALDGTPITCSQLPLQIGASVGMFLFCRVLTLDGQPWLGIDPIRLTPEVGEAFAQRLRAELVRAAPPSTPQGLPEHGPLSGALAREQWRRAHELLRECYWPAPEASEVASAYELLAAHAQELEASVIG